MTICGKLTEQRSNAPFAELNIKHEFVFATLFKRIHVLKLHNKKKKEPAFEATKVSGQKKSQTQNTG